ncbi:MAG: transcriptional activator NhaR [Methylophaga sp.]|nr:MAG: transcriptional activator NhaR [Methylophaga sp.]
MVNYKHLHYFWTVAKEGGIARASERLHITPQTISGQLSLLEEYFGVELFNKVGRHLEITEIGKQVLNYADEIFSLGNELEQMIRQLPADRPQLFRVGVVDVVPKSIAHKILQPALQMSESTRMICREADLDTLLAELTLHRLDLVIADRTIPPTVSTRGFSHKLGQCAISFFATDKLQKQLVGDFPHCLNGAPILLPSSGNQLRENLDQWLNKQHVYPRIVAEFDDSALMKAFGQQGVGIFMAPTAIQDEVRQQYKVNSIGQTNELTEDFYAISVEKRILNPIISAIIESASTTLLSGANNNE